MHVKAMVHTIVDTKLLVNSFRAIALHQSKFSCLVLINALDDVSGYWILRHLRVVSNDVGLGAQVLSLETPANLTWYPRFEVYDGAFVVDCFLLRIHLLAQIASIGRLIEA